jgi:nitrogen fixation/metabolism regulation signal transduction histidine kinase
MDIFLVWVGIVACGVAWYLWRVRSRSPHGFHLQFKLTLIFILLVLVPSIPLLFVVSGLLTQGVEMFLLPGVEQALSESLHAIKVRIEQPGQFFLETHSHFNQMNSSSLIPFQVDYAGEFQIRKGKLQQSILVQKPTALIPTINTDELKLQWDDKRISRIVSIDSTYICEVYHYLPDSIIQIVGYQVDKEIIRTKNNITESLRIYTSLSLLKRTLIEGRIIWGLAVVIVVLLSLLAIHAARLFSNGISHPITELATGMQRVAAGDLSSKVDVRAKDEVRILVDSFNQMAGDLRTSQEQLVKAERLAAWRDVARRISHEIKNILTPIQLSLHRLRRQFQEKNAETISESLTSIDEEIRSLQRMADEFSQFARMPHMQREPNDINLIIKAVVPLIEGGTKPVRIIQELETGLPVIHIDRDQLKRALHNLLKNGVEASPVNSTIFIRSFRRNESGVDIEIQDTGSGMDAETLSHIFDPYFTTKKRGMGLGLSIVRRIIEEHDGEITITSEQNKGTTVHIHFISS